MKELVRMIARREMGPIGPGEILIRAESDVIAADLNRLLHLSEPKPRSAPT
jgi:hypothetical protein